MAASKRRHGFVKGDTLRFDTPADAPLVPAKRPAPLAAPQGHRRPVKSARPAAPPASAAGGNGTTAAAGPALTHGNVGFRLLQKAGWRPGSGLGRNEHGGTEPIAPRTQHHTRGLGAAGTEAAPAAGGATAADAAKAAVRPPQQGPAGTGAEPGAVPRSGPAPVPRHWRAQVGVAPGDATAASAAARQEADQRRYLAISAALRREFAAPTTDAGGDTNPLTRRSKLTATNPLLDGSDEEWGGGGAGG